MSKYHIALSFAGEDREYVEKTADYLREHGVDVFYDKFEETKLWGKDLYSYLTDIYQNKAVFTVMFVSEAYKDKLWTNHERKSAQARAFSESKEYILPAMFDESVEIPGLLKTTGYISLKELSPEDFAQKIIQKLQDDGVLLTIESKFTYSDEAKADADFPMHKGTVITGIAQDLRSHNWYTQNPSVNKIFTLDFEKLNPDEIFILGRNIYQCACGGERKAKDVLNNLRREMSKLPVEAAEHMVNGMFYEVYFNAVGEFRGRNIKSECIDQLFAIQSVAKYSDCITFIRRALQPYQDSLVVLPNSSVEMVDVLVSTSRKDPPKIKDIVLNEKSMLVNAEDHEDSYSRMWKLSFRAFSISSLKSQLSNEWHIASEQLNLQCEGPKDDSTKYRLPEGKTIGHPCDS